MKERKTYFILYSVGREFGSTATTFFVVSGRVVLLDDVSGIEAGGEEEVIDIGGTHAGSGVLGGASGDTGGRGVSERGGGDCSGVFDWE